MAHRVPVSIRQIRRPICDRLGAGKNARAPARAGKGNGARERGRPRPHQPEDRGYDPFRSRKCGVRTFTGWGCPNSVSVPISASEGYLRRLRQPRIGTRDNFQATPQSGAGTQTTSLSLYFLHLGPQPDNEPFTLFSLF
ncbi:MAG: hypothetical protein GX456_01315 [Verrucomicrobia bacterium]|nr:hypothetical protein [Verrucomicrobiota bacterium]